MHRGRPLVQTVSRQITALAFVSAGHFSGESEAKSDSTLKIRVCTRASLLCLTSLAVAATQWRSHLLLSARYSVPGQTNERTATPVQRGSCIHSYFRVRLRARLGRSFHATGDLLLLVPQPGTPALRNLWV